MADEEDLKRLHAGDVDLSRSDLRGADLKGLDLRGRDFTGSHLDRADVSGADLRNCDFKDAHVVGMRAAGANFSGVRMPSILVSIDLAKADLSGADFQGSRLETVTLAGSTISSAKFNKAHFGKDVFFDDVIFDEGTDFDGAEGLRYLSRMPAFSNYDYERGRFVRRDSSSYSHDGEGQADSINLEPPLIASTSVLHAPDITRVQDRIAASPTEARVMAANLAVAVREHIALVSASKPNEPTSLARFEEQVSFLEHLAQGLHDIAVALEEEGKATVSEAKSRSINRAARIVADLSENLEAWMKENGRTLIGHTVNVGLIGASSAFFAYCGAPGLYGFAAAAALIGGKPLVEAAGALIKGSGNETE